MFAYALMSLLDSMNWAAAVVVVAVAVLLVGLRGTRERSDERLERTRTRHDGAEDVHRSMDRGPR